MVDVIIDLINLIFLFVGLFFTILFILLFSTNEKRIFKKPKMKNFPSISIVIPAHNEEKTIARTIKQVKKMIYPRKKEIIVVDNGSKDKTYEAAKKIRGIKIFKKKWTGKAKALNFGLKQAKGEVFVCVDSDSYPDKNALMNSVPFFEKNVGAVTTTVLVKDNKTLFEKMQQIEYILVSWSRKIFEYLESIYVTPGPMSLYKRKALIKVGGFDEKNMTEDIEIAWNLLRHKYKIKMALDAKVKTFVPSGIRGWWHQRIRWNIGGIQTFLKYNKMIFENGSVGMLLIPLFSVSYFLATLGFIFIFYTVLSSVQYLGGAYSFGFNVIGPIYIVPNLFWFFGLVSVLFALMFLRINLKTMRKVEEMPRKFLNFIFYLFVYMLIFPFNLLHSLIKYFNKSYKW